MIVFAAIVPHPPESIPGAGASEDGEKIKRTMSAINQLRIDLEKADPDLIIVISPHAYMEPYSFVINSATDLSGNFTQFGVDDALSFKNDIEMGIKLGYACQTDEVPAHLHPSFLDHGALIPLYHLTKNIKPKILHLSFSLMSYERHYRYGQIVKSIITSMNSRIAIIASGDLSHRLTPSAPAGYSPNAESFDLEIIHHLGENNLKSIMDMDSRIVDEAAERGIRSIIIMMGIIYDEKYAFKLMSYEGPFGVGYLVARFL